MPEVAPRHRRRPGARAVAPASREGEPSGRSTCDTCCRNLRQLAVFSDFWQTLASALTASGASMEHRLSSQLARASFIREPGRCAQFNSQVLSHSFSSRRLSASAKITQGPSAELGIGPPQAAWRGAVEHPSGGPSAPGRRCWRLGRKRPSPFSNSGPTPLRSDPNLEGLKV